MISFKKLDLTNQQDVLNILIQSRLPYEDIDLNVHHMIGAFDKDQLKGIAGLELYGNYALVRSVAVDARRQQKGLGSSLIHEVIKYSKTLNLSKLYLLTETAEGFFTKHGFSKTERGVVPQEVLNSKEFKHICPASAVCMMRQL